MKLGDLDTLEILDSTYYTYYDEFQKALNDGRNYRPPKLIRFLNQAPTFGLVKKIILKFLLLN